MHLLLQEYKKRDDTAPNFLYKNFNKIYNSHCSKQKLQPQVKINAKILTILTHFFFMQTSFCEEEKKENREGLNFA